VKKLSVDLENCYGIRGLKTEFDFSQQRVYAIYAPNGSMKSSLAQTFKDVADGVPSKDRVFPERVSKREIKDESGEDLAKQCVLVIRPYDEMFGHTEKTSTLLVDATLRAEYEQLHIEIDKARDELLKVLKTQSGSKRDLEKEISSAFTKSDEQFFVALKRVKEELLEQTDTPYADLPYDKIFDEKVIALLATKDFKTAIKDYVTRYNELLAASTYFKKDTFNYYNAATIAKSLADNGFFDAKHTVSLNADTTVEISSVDQLETLISKEKEGISNDADLRKKFAELEKLITKNVNVRDFHAYLSDHEELLPELANIEGLREKAWKSYLKTHIDLYLDLLKKYEDTEARKKEIEKAAAAQRTQWEAVIDIFNSRFFVPFTLIAKNRTAVILGEEPMLSLGFTFNDGESVEIDRGTLLQVLSSGEKKALYILNVIFEIEARKKGCQETVFVIDDIADSFDYKNKYAIIQYLKDIAEEQCFNQIILTHNFDFFRTVNSRFVRYDHCLMALKSSDSLTLNQATGIQNVFVKDWKLNFFSDPKKRIASVPFIRNIIEYTKGDQDPDFVKLTSLLHWKDESAAITQSELDGIYNAVFGGQGAWADGATSVIEAIHHEAGECLKAGDGINFENKIVLSIAVRLAAERFMVGEINDPTFTSGIDINQSAVLFTKYRQLDTAGDDAVRTLQCVMLMTPENIHLNSFMYEPILDMSDEHLRKLYGEVVALG
jgi:energy-coupling factor transporter ATP-binding protein EcfA2